MTTIINLTNSEAEYLIGAIEFTLKGEWFWQISPNPEAFGPVTLQEWHQTLTEGHRAIEADEDTLWVLYRLCADFTPKGEEQGTAKAVTFWNKTFANAESVAAQIEPHISHRRRVAEATPRKAKKAATKKAATKSRKTASKTARKPKAARSPELSRNDLIATLIRQNQQIIELLQAA